MTPGVGSSLLFSKSCDGYPFKQYRKVAYINSTGICNLNCEYCFTNNNKKPIGINKKDIDFLFDSFGDNFLLCFSGQGDFFAGYSKKQRFLEHILQRKVEVYLDFNGSIVNELFEISDHLLNKILHFDVSFHYETMVQKGMLETWSENISTLAGVIDPSRWDVKAIVAMCHLEALDKKIAYYAKNIFPNTNKKLNLVLDDFDNAVHSPSAIKLIDSVRSRYPEEVVPSKFSSKTINDQTTNQNYCVATSDDLFCPAGSLYFKISIDGDVMPCNKLGSGSKIRLGNLKQAKLGFIPQLVPCARLEGPGCLVNWDRRYPL